MVNEELKPWDKQEGESNRWFRRFSAYRLSGPGRSIQGIANKEKVMRGRTESRYTPGSWRNASKTWNWKVRAEAWDQSLSDEAEAHWKSMIMGENEVLARLSEEGRANINDFVILGHDGHIIGLKEEALKDRGYLVKKITSSEGKTDSIGIELYDGQTAKIQMGRHLKLFTDVQQHDGNINVVEMSLEEWKQKKAERNKEAGETLAKFGEEIESDGVDE